jgi:PncC family amidohydrolase
MNTSPLEFSLGQLLTARRLTLATAESCTGGLIGHRLTNVPGSSAYYLGGIVAYANEIKAAMLNVPWDTLNAHGAVSRETALAMARGVRAALGTDIGISVTGIAGPDGGTPEKPVGTVWIGLSAGDFEDAWRFLWDGDRLSNKELSAQAALQKVVDYLQGNPIGLA